MTPYHLGRCGAGPASFENTWDWSEYYRGFADHYREQEEANREADLAAAKRKARGEPDPPADVTWIWVLLAAAIAIPMLKYWQLAVFVGGVALVVLCLVYALRPDNRARLLALGRASLAGAARMVRSIKALTIGGHEAMQRTVLRLRAAAHTKVRELAKLRRQLIARLRGRPLPPVESMRRR